MTDAKELIQSIFKTFRITVPEKKMALLNEFLKKQQNEEALKTIIENQNLLIENWNMENRITDIIQQPVRILNATMGKPYETKFDVIRNKWKDIDRFHFEGLEEVGLGYDDTTRQITGVPAKSGDFKVLLKFKLSGEPEDSPFHEKPIPLIINPDPKSLWKNL
ncbi:MAG TPA: hypothetical protein VEZ17_13315, partial [Chitinophagaceae bacterium]|nr:hypothetical protein [Chitinophagaceae bacterium]